MEPVSQDRVTVVRGDALSLPFDDESFDIVWTQAVSQNIFDKRRFISELARVLRPGGRAAMFELVSGPAVQWFTRSRGRTRASRARSSPPSELHGLLEAEGLAVGPINRGQAVLESIFAAAEQLTPSPAQQSLGLELLMPDFEARMAGLARNVIERRIELCQAIATRPLRS